MQFDVIIPVKDRPTILTTIRSIIQSTDRIARVIIVDGGTTCVRTRAALKEATEFDCVEIVSNPNLMFNRGSLLNTGIRKSTSEILLLSDADIIWNKETLDKLTSVAKKQVYFVKSVIESDADQLVPGKHKILEPVVEIKNGTAHLRISSNTKLQFGERSGPGLIGTTRDAINEVNGYREDFTGWGWEDQDILTRFRLLRFEVVGRGRVTHLTHGDQERKSEKISKVDSRNANLHLSCEKISDGEYWGQLSSSFKPIANLLPPVKIEHPYDEVKK